MYLDFCISMTKKNEPGKAYEKYTDCGKHKLNHS